MNIFEKQIYHWIATIFLGIGVYALADDAALSGQLAGLSTRTWLWLSIVVPILHQVYVWFVWRVQLKYSLFTRVFGKNGFKIYAAGFSVLFASRLVSIIIMSISNRNSIDLNSAFWYTISCIFLVLSA